ncbi:hypothetical protein J1N35_043510 [Gossypium stocksii]|uniref:DUF4283 domain-containing protein n=1 Tax=Gossypium stocksii TaxID=47602 RepID=A0A9D3U7J6_9ROSI|nr:hypothetical protein J1N35_043510 [Gossypium stocksii]
MRRVFLFKLKLDALYGMVMNTTRRDNQKNNSWAEEDIKLQEGDVKKEIIDGIPSIEFSDRVVSLIEKSIARTIVFKLLGRKIGYVFWNKMCTPWKQVKRFQLMDIENDYYLAKFESVEDYTNVISKGPWVVFG